MPFPMADGGSHTPQLLGFMSVLLVDSPQGSWGKEAFSLQLSLALSFHLPLLHFFFYQYSLDFLQLH